MGSSQRSITNVNSQPPSTSEIIDQDTPTYASKYTALNKQQYKCDQCNNIIDLVNAPYSLGLLKHYMISYKCTNCIQYYKPSWTQKRGKEKQQFLLKYTTIFRCMESGCNKHGKVFYGEGAYGRWQTHYQKHHVTSQFLKATNQTKCNHHQCHIIVSHHQQFCKYHTPNVPPLQPIRPIPTLQPKPTQLENTILGRINQHTQYIQDNGLSSFNINNIFNQIDITFPIINPQQRESIIETLTQNISDVLLSYSDINKGINGAIAIKSFAPTYYYLPYKKENYNYNINQKKIRDQYYKQQKWQLLWKEIIHEQNKRNDKRKRQQIKYNNSDVIAGKPKAFLSKIQPSLDINLAQLGQQLHDIKHNNTDTFHYWKSKLKKCIYHCKEGKFKKASQVLDPSHICNLDINDNHNKLLSKLPKCDTSSIDSTPWASNIHYTLSQQDTTNIIKSINSQSAGGLFGIDNKTILFGITKNAEFRNAIYKLIKLIVENGLPSIVRDILCFSKGIPLGKEKNGQKDYDVRPIVIMDGLMRIIDKCVLASIKQNLRRALYSQYQVVGIPNSIEIANAALDTALDIQKTHPELALVNVDATNAYNNTNRLELWKLIRQYCPTLINYFKFLYGRPIITTFSHGRVYNVEQGLLQGLATSAFLYSTGKHHCQAITYHQLKYNFGYQNIGINNTKPIQINNDNIILNTPNTNPKQLKYVTNKINTQYINTENQFELYFSNHYIDDGLELMHYRYVPLYLQLLIYNYKRWNITINLNKTSIIFYNTNPKIVEYIQLFFKDIKIINKQNFKYLGAYKGSFEYVNQNLKEYIKLKFKKLLTISMITNQQIKTIMMIKFMEYNKFIFILKSHKYDEENQYPEWLKELDKLYIQINKIILSLVKLKDMDCIYQIMLSRRTGGLGQRKPSVFHPLSRLSALKGTIDKCNIYFKFDNTNKESFYNGIFKSEMVQYYAIPEVIHDMNVLYNTQYNRNIDTENNQTGIISVITNNNDNIIDIDSDIDLEEDNKENELKIDNPVLNIHHKRINDNILDIYKPPNKKIKREPMISKQMKEQWTKYHKSFNVNISKINQQIFSILMILKMAGSMDIQIQDVKGHKSLIENMDKYHKNILLNKNHLYTSIRILALSNPGTANWMTTPVNNIYGHIWDNQDMYILMNIYLGGTLMEEERECKICKKRHTILDGFNCNRSLITKRHHTLVHIFSEFFRKAGFHVETEQMVKECKENQQRPGDIRINDWLEDDSEITCITYMDITVANPYKNSIIQQSSKNRLAAAKALEQDKRKKYENIIHLANQQSIREVKFIPLGMEIHGNISYNTKKALQKAAKQISIRKVVPAALEMQWMRTRIVNCIMQYNIKIIKSCFDL